MQQIFLGIDGGGTKTDVVAVDAQGAEIGSGSSGPTNLTSTSLGAAGFNLKEAVRQTLERVQGEYEVTATMGLAGMDTEQEYEMAYRAFIDILRAFSVTQFQLVHDSQIALANGTENPNAVVLISGTGSICVGKNEFGHTAKAGGMDYLLTDQGSGYDIGRHVLREAVKSFDGRREKTMLETLVAEHFQLPDLSDIKSKVYHPLLNKVEIAELSQLCGQAYQAGDEAAKDIFEWAVRELVVMVRAVFHRLDLSERAVDVVLTGSVVGLEQVSSHLRSELLREFPNITFVVPERPAVYGAARMALQSFRETQS